MIKINAMVERDDVCMFEVLITTWTTKLTLTIINKYTCYIRSPLN